MIKPERNLKEKNKTITSIKKVIWIFAETTTIQSVEKTRDKPAWRIKARKQNVVIQFESYSLLMRSFLKFWLRFLSWSMNKNSWLFFCS